MDLSNVATLRAARERADLELTPGEVVLAGGTWLFSEPQPAVTGLVDLGTMGWPAWEELDGVLRIAATCTIEQLLAAPWGAAADLARQCADSLLMSWKVQHVATVGGNVCLALPAGAMISLTAGLGATVVIWTPEGTERREPVAEFVRDAGITSLRPGEVVRAVDVPTDALVAPTAFRRIALTSLGRAASVVVGVGSRITVTAATRRPVVLDASDLEAGLDAIDCWYDDLHGPPDWRAHVTRLLAHDVLQELGG